MNWNQLLLRLQFFTLLVSGFLCLCVWAGPNPGKLCPNGSTACIRHHLLQRGLIRDDPRGKALRLSPGINLRWDFCSLLFNLFIFCWYYVVCSLIGKKLHSQVSSHNTEKIINSIYYKVFLSRPFGPE